MRYSSSREVSDGSATRILRCLPIRMRGGAGRGTQDADIHTHVCVCAFRHASTPRRHGTRAAHAAGHSARMRTQHGSTTLPLGRRLPQEKVPRCPPCSCQRRLSRPPPLAGEGMRRGRSAKTRARTQAPVQRASSDSTAASARRCGGPAAASVAIDAQFARPRRDDTKGHEVQKKTKIENGLF